MPHITMHEIEECDKDFDDQNIEDSLAKLIQKVENVQNIDHEHVDQDDDEQQVKINILSNQFIIFL